MVSSCATVIVDCGSLAVSVRPSLCILHAIRVKNRKVK